MPLHLHSVHQELSLPLASTTPRSILAGDHRSPKLTIHPNAPSAAELAAGDSLHPRLPYDHRKDRLGVADTFLHSDAHEEPPNAGEDRRSPASVRPEEEGGRLVKPDQWARHAHCQ